MPNCYVVNVSFVVHATCFNAMVGMWHYLIEFCGVSFSVFVISDAEIVWCQEEPMNMGAFNYITPRLGTAMKALGRGTMEDVKYVGRAPSAATATGFYQVHVKEQAEIVQTALQKDPINYPW